MVLEVVHKAGKVQFHYRVGVLVLAVCLGIVGYGHCYFDAQVFAEAAPEERVKLLSSVQEISAG